MPFLLLITYAIALSLTVPALFFLLGPVKERRPQLGFSYATAITIVWGALVPLAFLSPAAMAAAAATLTSLAAVAALYGWRNGRLLARFDARLADPASRAAGLLEIYERLDELSHASRAAVAVMEVAGWPTRRLIAQGCYPDALQLLDEIEARVGSRLTTLDRHETRLLRALVYLHLGRLEEANSLLEEGREEKAPELTEELLLRSLLEVCDAGHASAPKLPGRPVIWLPWNRALNLLIEAHLAADRGEEAEAVRILAILPERPHGTATLDLARILRGPASELAAMIGRPSAPYR